MLSAQHLLATKKAYQPRPSPPGSHMKATRKANFRLPSFLWQQLRLITNEDKPELKTIHFSSVFVVVHNEEANKVLLALAPDVHSSDRILPRANKVNLSRLRSDYSPFPRYLHRIQTSLYDDSCPDCGQSPNAVPSTL